MKRSFLILLTLLLSVQAFADDIEVPEEELAHESTLPVFTKRRVVLNRNVLTSERFELGAGAGLALNDPFYNTYMFNGQVTYNIDEVNAANVQMLYWMTGLSSYGQQLLQGTPTRQSFDASKAPHPQWAVLGNYEYIAYYGKISVTKQTVMNLNLFGILGVGYINMGTTGVPALNIGLGQNFFVTKNIGVRWDLRWLIFQGPNPASIPLTPAVHPAASAFGNRLFFDGQLGLSLVYVL